MIIQKRVYLLYEANKDYFWRESIPTIDNLFPLMHKLKRSKDFILGVYGGKINCEVILNKDKNTSRYEFMVIIKEKKEADLTKLLKEFFGYEEALPNFVRVGSDYAAIDRALKEFGKKLQRKWNGFSIGKHVIDLEEKMKTS